MKSKMKSLLNNILNLGMAAVAGSMIVSHPATAQTTNALDLAADPAYTGDGPPNGLSSGLNGGYGFGPWTFAITGNGGAFISSTGPSGASWDLWNVDANGSSIAVRPFSLPLVAGQSFSFQMRLNSLDNSGTTNAMILQDASGKTIFSYWHTGFEPNGAVNGQFTDAVTTDGAAVGFSYNYQQFCSFTFTLNSATTYTFTDNTTAHSFTGVISGSIAQVAFFRGSQSSTGNGQDFQFDELQVISSPPPTFVGQTPAAGSYSASRTNISVQVIAGGSPVNTNTIILKVDGNAVTPTMATASGITTVAYSPASPLSGGALHTVQISLADNSNSRFTNTWSFTTGFSALPVILPGPMVVSNSDITIFSAAGDNWLGTNYGPNSSRTLYTRFSMAFDNLNGETGGGGGYGGLHFFEGNAQHLIVGNSWISMNWSLDTMNGELDLNPGTPIIFGEWHTIVEKINYSPGVPATVNVWLDFDFNQPEASQPNGPLTFTMDNTFDSVHLRAGNGTTSATFTNIILGALGTDVGILPAAPPGFQGFTPGNGASSAAVSSPVSLQVVVGSVGIKTSAISMTLDGNAVTPTFSTAGQIITVTYQPPGAFAANSSHTVAVNLTDTNGTPYSTSWSFTTDAYPSLPVTIAGPIDVSGGGLGVTIFSNLNGWISANYQSTSTNTLWTRFSMVFFDLNGEVADDTGGCFGGLHFYQDTTEHMLVGQTWLRNTWSVDDKAGGEGGELSLLPPTVTVVNEWHTMVVKSVYASNAPTAETIYLDPDFTKTEGNQSPLPLMLSTDNTFNTVRLRCGNGSAAAEYTNVVMAATAQGVGFHAPVAPGVLSTTHVGGTTQLSWTSIGTLQVAPAVTGPWTDAASQANPQPMTVTDSAQFFRLRQ